MNFVIDPNGWDDPVVDTIENEDDKIVEETSEQLHFSIDPDGWDTPETTGGWSHVEGTGQKTSDKPLFLKAVDYGKEKIEDPFCPPHYLRMDNGDQELMIKGRDLGGFIIETEYTFE